MSEEIKKYLHKMVKENNGFVFMFYQFYLHPEVFLGGESEETIKDYYNYGHIKELLVSYKIFEFMLLCLSDDDFRRRIDGRINLVRKMRFMAYDFREFRNKYRDIFNNESFIRMLYGKEEIGEWREKYNLITLLSYKDFYDKFGWLYNIGLEHEKAMEIDDKMLIQVMVDIGLWEDVFYERYILPERKEEKFIKELEKGNYKEVFDRFDFIVDNSEYMNITNLRALVCSNKLLDLCERELLNSDLSYYEVETIIDLMQMSLDLSRLDFERDSIYEWYYNMIGEKRISEYNADLAEQIIDKFEKKIHNSKVIKLY